MAGREPQSYGSEADWAKGTTGQRVNDPKAVPRPEHRAFYDKRRESEAVTEYDGGRNSPVQLAESDTSIGISGGDEVRSVQRVTAEESGAKRNSYFRKRDYD